MSFSRSDWKPTRSCHASKTLFWMQQDHSLRCMKTSPDEKTQASTRSSRLSKKAFTFLVMPVLNFHKCEGPRFYHASIPTKTLVVNIDFSRAALFLFHLGFRKKIMEWTKAVRCLQKVAAAPRKGNTPLESFSKGLTPIGDTARGAGTSTTTLSATGRVQAFC